MKPICAFFILFLATSATSSTGGAIEIGHQLTIESKILGEERTLLVALPESYAGSSFRYPVYYLLDADPEFLHTAGVIEFLGGTDQVPELILVGVTNTVRSRDLTPKSRNEEETAFWPEVGGAERFRRFFRKDLIPFIDEKYRTEPFRIIRGQSFGGLFAIHDFMSEDPLFDAYLTTSPAVSWNFDELIMAVPGSLPKRSHRFLYVGSAGRDFPGNLAGIERFHKAILGTGRAGDRYRYRHYAGESHYSLVHLASYDSLTFLFEGWQVPDTIARKADFSEFERHYAGLSERYGFRIKIPMNSVIRLGNNLLREKRFEEGIQVLKRNLDLWPGQPESHWHVGDAYELSGQVEAAIPHFERAYEMARKAGAPDLDDYRRSIERAKEKLE